MAGCLADCVANWSGGWSFAWLLAGWLAKISDGWPDACMPARCPFFASEPACASALFKEGQRVRGVKNGSEGRPAGRLTVNSAGWLAEPLPGWLPFCWLVGGLAPDCISAWGISMLLCCLPALAPLAGWLPACPPSLAAGAESHVCPGTFLDFATTRERGKGRKESEGR